MQFPSFNSTNKHYFHMFKLIKVDYPPKGVKLIKKMFISEHLYITCCLQKKQKYCNTRLTRHYWFSAV